MKLIKTSDSLGECHVSVAGDVSHKPSAVTCPLRHALGSFSARRVLLNLESATSIDSSGVQWLLACRRAIHDARGELVLHSVPPCVAAPLGLLNLAPLFTIAENLKAAAGLPARREVA